MATIRVILNLKPNTSTQEFGTALFSDTSVTTLSFKRDGDFVTIEFEATAKNQGDLTTGIIAQLWALKGIKSLTVIDVPNGNGSPEPGTEVPPTLPRRSRRAPAT